MPVMRGTHRPHLRRLTIGDLNPIFWLKEGRGVYQDVAKTTLAAMEDVVGAYEDAAHVKDDIAAADVEQGTTASKPTRKRQGLLYDGLDDFLKQKVYDTTEQGNLTFVADGGSAEFRDDGQDFGDWATTPAATAAYMLVVTSDNGVSWGYMGADNNSGQDIDIYSDKGLTTRGWKGRTTPQATPDTPASYEVWNTLTQITGALTMGAWVKLTSSAFGDGILSKRSGGFVAYSLYLADNGVRFYLSGGCYRTPSVTINDGNYHFVVAVFVPSLNCDIFTDGVLTNGILTGAIPAALRDMSQPLLIALRYIGDAFLGGHIGDPFILDYALDAKSIHELYESMKERYN